MALDMTADTQEAGVRLVQQLGAAGVEYAFTTFGTDHPTLIKGLAHADAPTAVLAPDEMVAASAAHGYAQVTGRPQVVIAHVDVGTANLGPSLHNSARSQIPMLVLAGRTPYTTRGERPGSRSIFVHWYQDVYDQHSLVREYANWTYELETGANVDRVVARSLDMCQGPPPGPSYLTLPREVLREEAPSTPETSLPRPESTPTTIDTPTREKLLDLLATADDPLLITSYFGREEPAVDTLVSFAETTGVPVVEAAPAFDMNFPRDHPLHLGYTADTWLETADLILIAACEVPWVPLKVSPQENATVVQIDTDPAKAQYPMWDFRPDITVRADPQTVLNDLTNTFENSELATTRIDRTTERHTAQREDWNDQADAPADSITPARLSTAIGQAIDDETIIVDETVTNTIPVLRHLPRTQPGTYYSYCSSGLGWALGASVGIKLARPTRRLVTVVGDGSFLFGNPLATFEMIEACEIPHLWVVYNNRGWQAVANAVHDQYEDPDFLDEAFVRFPAEQNFAAPFASLGCYADRVTDPDTLSASINAAIEAVDDGTHAILDVEVSTPTTE